MESAAVSRHVEFRLFCDIQGRCHSKASSAVCVGPPMYHGLQKIAEGVNNLHEKACFEQFTAEAKFLLQKISDVGERLNEEIESYEEDFSRDQMNHTFTVLNNLSQAVKDQLQTSHLRHHLCHTHNLMLKSITGSSAGSTGGIWEHFLKTDNYDTTRVLWPATGGPRATPTEGLQLLKDQLSKHCDQKFPESQLSPVKLKTENREIQIKSTAAVAEALPLPMKTKVPIQTVPRRINGLDIELEQIATLVYEDINTCTKGASYLETKMSETSQILSAISSMVVQQRDVAVELRDVTEEVREDVIGGVRELKQAVQRTEGSTFRGTMSIMEIMRQVQEDIWYKEVAAASLLSYRDLKSGMKQQLWQQGVFIPADARLEHAARKLLVEISNEAREQVHFYRDESDVRKNEICAIGGGEENDPQGEFYKRLRAIEDRVKGDRVKGGELRPRDEVFDPHAYHKREALRMTGLGGDDITSSAILSMTKLRRLKCSKFNRAEMGGSCLDLMESYEMFIGLGRYRRYREGIFVKAATSRILRQDKSRKLALAAAAEDSEVEGESSNLCPSIDWQCPTILAKIQFTEIDCVAFIRQLKQLGKIPRCFKYRCDDYSNFTIAVLKYLWDFLQRRYPMKEYEVILSRFAEEFLLVWKHRNVEGWAQPSMKLALYSEPTDRIFVTEGTRSGHEKSKKYLVAKDLLEKLNLGELEARRESSLLEDKRNAWREFQIYKLMDMLNDAVERTTDELHRKQSQIELEGESDSSEDLDMPSNEAETSAEDDGESSAEQVTDTLYNPLKLPLGPDGKPIPYWVYKLHGLDKEYRCEICGNYSYWGQYQYEKHFTEWRHAFGMRCLKIPNTPHFKEITGISDAVALYENLLKRNMVQAFDATTEEQIEDLEGNVFTAAQAEQRRG